MNKYIIPLIFFAVCLFSACREDFYEPDAVPAEAISLSVCDAGFAASNGSLSRSSDSRDGVTVFDRNDTIGLIILDAGQRLLVDNVPYSYDGTKWDFCSGNTEGKERAYFDKEMTNYIVYYPYTPGANGVKSEDELMMVKDLLWHRDQSTEDAFRKSDLMMWTYSGSPLKKIDAPLTHVRNSLSIELTVRYKLTLKDESNQPVVIEYHPKRLHNDKIVSYFEDLTINIGSEMIRDSVYNAQEANGLARLHLEDGAYRYILPPGCGDLISWRYYYKGTTYTGQLQASSDDLGVRYRHEEFIDMGILQGKNILPGDFYCSKEVNDANIGYVMPHDALELMHNTNCIGIVFQVGQHSTDTKDFDYPPEIYMGTDTEDLKQCHGYAVALTNASEEAVRWCTQKYKSDYMGTGTANNIWNGYTNCKAVTGNSKYKSDPAGFPAVYLCKIYGESTSLRAPDNSSGWYLPSCAQGMELTAKYSSYLEPSFNFIVKINDIIDHYIDTNKSIGFVIDGSRYWSSSESSNVAGSSFNAWVFRGRDAVYSDEKAGDHSMAAARPILSF